jgi:hypothetical protein
MQENTKDENSYKLRKKTDNNDMTTEYDRADSSHKSIVTLYFDYNIKVLSN